MIELPTPETDSLFWENGYPVKVDSSKAMQLCEKLEQERDWITEKFKLLEGCFKRSERERDEAQVAIRALAEHAEAEIQRITKERDEAREAAAKWESLSDALERRRNAVAQRADENREWALKAEKERDEAREALASREVVIAQQNVITDLMLERDAARAVANELSDVASKHLSFLLAITPTRPNDTHEKETEKVIDALKPWKKL